jgi:selenide,water dikinase
MLLELVWDPQTSGGLLIAVEPKRATELLTSLHSAGITHARLIGEVIPREGAALKLK